jgi:hypothetical protein
MRFSVARPRIGQVVGGVVVALAAVLASRGGTPTNGATVAAAQESPPAQTTALPACGTPVGSGITNANPIVENEGIANVLNNSLVPAFQAAEQ